MSPCEPKGFTLLSPFHIFVSKQRQSVKGWKEKNGFGFTRGHWKPNDYTPVTGVNATYAIVGAMSKIGNFRTKPSLSLSENGKTPRRFFISRARFFISPSHIQNMPSHIRYSNSSNQKFSRLQNILQINQRPLSHWKSTLPPDFLG